MPIISKSIANLSLQRSGLYRARFIYTLKDGREIHRGPVNARSIEDAETLMSSIEPDALKGAQIQDAQEAVNLGIQTAHKEATAQQVQYSWLQAGFNEDEHYKAYEKMKRIGPALLSLGLTDAQFAEMFNTDIEDVTAVREYWEFLAANKESIESYARIAGVVL